MVPPVGVAALEDVSNGNCEGWLVEAAQEVDGKHLSGFNGLVVGLELSSEFFEADGEVFNGLVGQSFEGMVLADEIGDINEIGLNFTVAGL